MLNTIVRMHFVVHVLYQVYIFILYNTYTCGTCYYHYYYDSNSLRINININVKNDGDNNIKDKIYMRVRKSNIQLKLLMAVLSK